MGYIGGRGEWVRSESGFWDRRDRMTGPCVQWAGRLHPTDHVEWDAACANCKEPWPCMGARKRVWDDLVTVYGAVLARRAVNMMEEEG